VALLTPLFLLCSADCDLYLYREYARLWRASSLRGLYETRAVEYPPAAVGLVLAADELAAHLPDRTPLERFKVYRVPPDLARYKAAFRLLAAGATIGAFLTLAGLVRRCYPHETPRDRLERLAAFGLALVPLGPVLFDRLDIFLALLILVALRLLVGGHHYAWSFAALGLATAFKVIPAALAPVWVLASLPVTAWAGGVCRLLAAAGWRSAVLVALTSAWFLPSCLVGGPQCLAFFAYHRERGIEYESSYAAALAVLRHCGYPSHVSAGFGSGEVMSTLSPLLTRIAPGLTAGLLLGAAGLLATAVARSAGGRRPGAAAARENAPLVAGHVLLAMMLVVLTNKVWSPQYLLWLAPLAALVPSGRRGRRAFSAGFLAVCGLTYLIFPASVADVLGAPLPVGPGHHAGPTSFGTALLVSRTLLLGGLTSVLGIALVRRARGVAGDSVTTLPFPVAVPVHALPKAG
jgi:hypothetical protein